MIANVMLLERDAILGRLEGLPDDERAVVVLHYWADLTQEAVAERLWCPVGTDEVTTQPSAGADARRGSGIA